MKALHQWRNAVALFGGITFGVGLSVAGMTQPDRIINFLNPSSWDASLLFVMVGAVGVHMVSYPLVRKRKSPVLDSTWHVPDREDITPRLIIGSALFGIGWALSGYCPGPGITSLATGEVRALYFTGAMVVGMILSLK